MGREEVKRLGIYDIKQLSAIAPNFYIPSYGTRMTSSIYVRGIGSRMDQPVVALNVDNVPFLNKDMYDFDVPEIERIEVIRGPQATLYGRNSMCGVVNIYTISPLHYQGLRAMLSGKVGDPGLAASLSYYGKIADNLGMSLSGGYRGNRGTIKNRFNGRHTGNTVDANLRWRTAWRVSRNVNIDNTFSFGNSYQYGYPYEFSETREVNYNDTCEYKRKAITDGLALKWTTGKFTLSSITSLQWLDDKMTLDQDFLPESFFTLVQKRKETGITQDIVLRSIAGDSPYEWIAGVFGYYRHTDMHAPVTFKETGIEKLIVDHRNEANPYYPIAWDDDTFVLGSEFVYPTKGIAFYHQSTLRLDKVTISAGLRLDYEHSALNYRSHCNTSYTIYDNTGEIPVVFDRRRADIDDRGHLSRSFTRLLPKLTVSTPLPMRSPGTLYFSVGEGYKSGGFNTQMFSDVLQQRIMGMMGLASLYSVDDIVTYKPEWSINYELGANVTCADGRVNSDLALFLIDCHDQQLTVFPSGTTTGRITANAGRTRSLGAEAGIKYYPSQKWKFALSYGFTNATFRKFFNGKADYRGKRVPYAPANTLFASATRSDYIASLRGHLSVSAFCNGVGSIYWDEANLHKQPFYFLVGLSVQYLRGKSGWELRGENITDTKYDLFSFVSMSNTFFQRGKPLSLSLTYRYNM